MTTIKKYSQVVLWLSATLFLFSMVTSIAFAYQECHNECEWGCIGTVREGCYKDEYGDTVCGSWCDGHHGDICDEVCEDVGGYEYEYPYLYEYPYPYPYPTPGDSYTTPSYNYETPYGYPTPSYNTPNYPYPTPMSNCIPIVVPQSATGGAITTINEGGVDYMVHTFTSSGTFSAPQGMCVELLTVAGGGGGGPSASGDDKVCRDSVVGLDRYGGGGGGGGAGGVIYLSGTTVSAGNTSVSVGGGGLAGTGTTRGGNGSPSSFGTVVSTGGGGGGAGAGSTDGLSGGSGGGSAIYGGARGLGIAGQGHDGGRNPGRGCIDGAAGGGGGGAGVNGGQAGQGGSYNAAGPGGDGSPYSIKTGNPEYYGGGGGGGGANTTPIWGWGGAGGGGSGGRENINNGVPGTPNTGGGGGGGRSGHDDSAEGDGRGRQPGGGGGSGIVIVRYPITTIYTLNVSVSGSGVVSGPGINCPGDCTEDFPSSTWVTLIATPDVGHDFDSWVTTSGSICGGQGSTCSDFIDGDKTAQVNFVVEPPAFNYDLTNSGNASAILSSNDVYTNKTITRTLTSGSAQPVTLDIISNIPKGVTYSISNRSCSPSPTCSSVINFTIASSTNTGIYPVYVEGTPLNKQTIFDLTISAGALWVSCSVSPSTASVGELVTWNASVNGGVGPFTYAWSGTNIPTSPAPSSNPYSISYGTTGQKAASVLVTDTATSQQASCPATSIQVYFDPQYEEF